MQFYIIRDGYLWILVSAEGLQTNPPEISEDSYTPLLHKQ